MVAEGNFLGQRGKFLANSSSSSSGYSSQSTVVNSGIPHTHYQLLAEDNDTGSGPWRSPYPQDNEQVLGLRLVDSFIVGEQRVSRWPEDP